MHYKDLYLLSSSRTKLAEEKEIPKIEDSSNYTGRKSYNSIITLLAMYLYHIITTFSRQNSYDRIQN